MSHDTIPSRNRITLIVLMVFVLAAGLLWRSDFIPLSPFFKKYGGVALWALLVFFGFGFLMRRVTTRWLSAISLCFAWLIEFSQLYHAPWIDSIRAMHIGHLIIGSRFNWPDLLAYGLGVALGSLCDLKILRKTNL
ncbi:MAG: DUF2809 domain-containing protein [Akkermansiaceae bacterium]|nr:DUF2809 domain-containing protein [Akkermansiaceae bacterium]